MLEGSLTRLTLPPAQLLGLQQTLPCSSTRSYPRLGGQGGVFVQPAATTWVQHHLRSAATCGKQHRAGPGVPDVLSCRVYLCRLTTTLVFLFPLPTRTQYVGPEAVQNAADGAGSAKEFSNTWDKGLLRDLSAMFLTLFYREGNQITES